MTAQLQVVTFPASHEILARLVAVEGVSRKVRHLFAPLARHLGGKMNAYGIAKVVLGVVKPWRDSMAPVRRPQPRELGDQLARILAAIIDDQLAYEETIRLLAEPMFEQLIPAG